MSRTSSPQTATISAPSSLYLSPETQFYTTLPLHSTPSPQSSPPAHTSPRAPPNPRKSPATTSLVFVNLNESTGPSQDMGTRKEVRAHVMRDFQQKRRGKAGQERKRVRKERVILPSSNLPLQYATQGKERSSVAVEEVSEEGEEVEEVKRHDTMFVETALVHMLPSSQEILQIGSSEPFDVLPWDGSSRLRSLIHYYNTVLVNTLIPVNPKDKWFNYAITDPALFHATMLHAVMHRRLVSGTANSVAGLEDQWVMKRDTIGLVNQRLNDPIWGVSDVTIGAVVCLVLFENQSANVELSNIHMNGLKRMVELRGGINSLGLAGVLRRKILWADLLNSFLSNTEPRFNLSPLATDYTHLIPFLPVGSGSAPPTSLEPTCTCLTEFSSLITSLRHLSNTKNIIQDTSGLLSDRIYLVERQLLYLLQNTRSFPHLHSPLCATTGRSLFFAAQMYIYRNLREFPRQVPVFEAFVERMIEGEGEKIFEGVVGEWRGNENLLVWVLVLGAVVSEGERRKRFVQTLGTICGMIGIWSLESLTDCLEGVIWRQARKDREMKALWDEVLDFMMQQVII